MQLSGEPLGHPVDMALDAAGERLLICERGTCFGYNDLVVDMRSLVVLSASGAPVVFDASHSVQRPGLAGDRSGGQREFVPALARAAVAVGIAGIFFETHPDPAAALCDGPNSWPVDAIEPLLEPLIAIDAVAKATTGIVKATSVRGMTTA